MHIAFLLLLIIPIISSWQHGLTSLSWALASGLVFSVYLWRTASGRSELPIIMLGLSAFLALSVWFRVEDEKLIDLLLLNTERFGLKRAIGGCYLTLISGIFLLLEGCSFDWRKGKD